MRQRRRSIVAATMLAAALVIGPAGAGAQAGGEAAATRIGATNTASTPRTGASPATAAATMATAATGASALPASTSPAEHTPGDGRVTVTLTEITPTVVDQSSTFSVTVSLTNTTDQVLTGTVSLNIARVVLQARTELDDWLQGSSEVEPASVTDQDFTLAARTTGTVTLSVPAAELNLLTSLWAAGPRGISVTATGGEPAIPAADPSDDAATSAAEPAEGATLPTPEPVAAETPTLLGEARTFLLWQPVEPEATPAAISVLVPVTGSAADVAALDTASGADADEAITASPARLSNVTAAVAGQQAVTLAIDPAVIAMAQGTLPQLAGTPADAPEGDETAEPSPSPSAPDSGTASPQPLPTATAPQHDAEPAADESDGTKADWAAQTLAIAETLPVFALPVFDQDVATVGADQLAPSAALAQATAFAASWETGLAVPRESNPALGTLEAAAASGSSIVVARSGYATVDDSELISGSGTTVATSSGTVTVLTTDQVLSTLLTDPGTDATPASARQRILAELAVFSRTEGDQARALFVALPRDWNPDPAVAAAQLEALATSPWSQATDVTSLASQIAAGAIATTARVTPTAGDALPDEVAGRLDAPLWRDLAQQARDVQAFTAIAADPSGLSDPITDGTIALAGIASAADPAAREATAAVISEESHAILGSQAIVLGSDINLIAHSSELPVTVSNALNQPTTVMVRLTPDDPRLNVPDDVTVTVPANSQQAVTVPVTAVGSGNVTVQIDLLSVTGQRVSEPVSLAVRVRADWESIGTAILFGAVALLVTVGIIRTIRRGQARTRIAEAAVATVPADDDKTGEVGETPMPDARSGTGEQQGGHRV